MNLPDGWELRESSDYPGRVFYLNSNSHECTWIRPIPYPGLFVPWPPMICVVQIAMFHADSKSENHTSESRTREDALRRIHDIYRRVTEGISEIEDVALFESDLKTNESIWICRGEKSRGFEDVAWKLDIGEFSEPMDTPEGFFILLRTG
jgi:NIMA-interacting peptidyl-prolyl cis-trans isomerase 1